MRTVVSVEDLPCRVVNTDDGEADEWTACKQVRESYRDAAGGLEVFADHLLAHREEGIIRGVIDDERTCERSFSKEFERLPPRIFRNEMTPELSYVFATPNLGWETKLLEKEVLEIEPFGSSDSRGFVQCDRGEPIRTLADSCFSIATHFCLLPHRYQLCTAAEEKGPGDRLCNPYLAGVVH